MKKILVVEDDPGVVGLYKYLCGSMEKEVLTVEEFTGAAVEKIFLEHQFEITHVISDANLGCSDFTGVDVVRIIRCLDKDIPILAISSLGDIQTKMLKEGATLAITKPFQLAEVMSHLG